MPDNCSAAGAVVDRAVLDDLRSIQEPDQPSVLSDMIDLFLRNTPSRLESLRSALAARDYAGVARTLHSLKGSCGLFGARRMITVCEKLQEAVHACDLLSGESGLDGSICQSLAGLMDALEAEYHLVQIELEKCR